jgi:phage shock protein PspC (stress-responsive transcriptional regulator)
MEVDPVWIRLAFVALTFIGGLGILLYIVGWVVMPAVDAAPPAGLTPGTPYRRIYRLRQDRVVAGVASGLAAHMDVDPTWVRLAFVVLIFFGGIGVVLYIAGWVLIPAVDGLPPYGAGPVPIVRGRGAGTDLRIIAGAFFLIIAVLVLAGNFNFYDSGLVWGVALVVIGVLFLVGDSWPAVHPAGPPAMPFEPVLPTGFASPAPGAGPVPPAHSPAAPVDQLYTAPSTSSYAAPPSTPPLYTPPSYRPYTPPVAYGAPAYGAPTYAAPLAWSPTPVRSRGVHVGALGLAAVILALGVALLLQSAGAIHLTVAIGFGIVFVVLGVTLAAGAWFGRAPLLVALGICLLPFAAAAVLVPEPLTGGVGNVSYAPQALPSVQPAYRLVAGQLYVDLSGVDLGAQSVTVTSSVAFGHLVVVVPADVTVDVTSKMGAGEVDLLGRIDSGVQISSHFVATTGTSPTGTLDLTVDVGCGQLTVTTGGADVQTRAGRGGAVPVTVTSTATRRLVAEAR